MLNKRGQDEIILAHMPVVGYQVSEMIRRVPAHVGRDELAAAGALALVQAARAFNPELGVPFGRYAAVRVRGAIVDALRAMDWASRGARLQARKLTELTENLTAALGRTPTRAELAQAMGTDATEVDAARAHASRRLLSLDAEGVGAAETLPTPTPGPEEQFLVSERARYLAAAVEELPERLRTVVEQLYFHDRPVAELADELGVTQSRISQLRSEALSLLKDGMNTALEPELAPRPSVTPGLAERRRQAYCAGVAARAAASLARVAQGVALPSARPLLGVG
jgi:RNA polymerase sigma factor for flagellar operon FliA